MIDTKTPVDAIRAHLDATQPGWQERVRADLDALTPGWQSFPLLVWNEGAGDWTEVVLLANPEPVTAPAAPAPGGPWARVRRFLRGR